MKNLAKFSVEKAITVFMAVILVMVFGVVSYTRLSTDLFPSMNIPYSVVVTTYIGASPEEVEEVVTKPLEEVLSTTTNIASVESRSQENVSVIILEFNSDANMDSAIIEMRENLDMILAQLPDEVGSPMIIKLNPDMMPVMQFSVSGDMFADQQELTNYVYDSVLPQVERIPGVASVSVSGAYESEVRLVLNDAMIANIDTQFQNMQDASDPLDLVENFHFDKEFISQILQAQNFAFPIGYVNVENVNYLVRVGDDFGSPDELADLILLDASANGLIVTLGDILVPDENGDVIRYVNANEREYSTLNGNPSISVTVQKSANFATTDVTKEIIALLEEMGVEDATSFTILLDQGEYIEQATGNVTDNLMYGAILAVLVLLVFLRSARATLIVALAIPISLMFAIILIYLTGITLNIVSLGGLALGIGMLVDNSIVVMENIFRMKKEGATNKDAAIKGTQQVGGAIIASTITTIAVFLPIIFIEGFIKEIFMQMALTIAFSLIASLMIALTLVPAISSKILKDENNSDKNKEKAHNKFKNVYEKLFNTAFKFKALILILAVILFGVSIPLSLQNGFEYFPASDEGQLNVSINKDVSIDSPMTDDEFTELLDQFTEDVLLIEEVETIGISLGSLQGSFLGITNSDAASASIILKSDRERTTTEVETLLFDLLSSYDGITFDVSGSQQQTSMLTGSGIQIQLQGHDLQQLKAEAEKVAELLSSIDGLIDVDSGVGKESEELKITVRKDDAIKYFITNAQVLGVVATSFAQEEVVTTISVSGTLYDIYVYDENSIDSETEFTISDIENLVVGVSQLGVPVFLYQVADVEIQKGFTTINRIDGTRSVTISAEYAEGINTTEVSNQVTELLESDYQVPEGFSYLILGEQEEVMEAVNVLVLAMGLAVLLIYMIMASQFQSLTYPFIIMFTIPLAFTGGFAILWITGMTVSVVAIIGLIILVGVVVNNGIVLVDYTNQLREQGLDVKEALLEAGKTRLRPIIMTALTTILALSTMAIGLGEGAEMMQPMAVTTIGGLLYATVLTLLVVPIMYYLVTKYSKQIFGFGFGGLFVLLGIVSLVLAMIHILISISFIVVGLAIIAFIIVIQKRSELYE